MRLKIRCDGESENFYKIFWKLNKAPKTYTTIGSNLVKATQLNGSTNH